MSIENNPAIEILNTVVTTKGGDPFVLAISIAIVHMHIYCRLV